MLVLSRRADQEVIFPNLDITVRVLQIKGKIVKLGVTAPRGIPILRPEACNDEEMAAFRRNFDAGGIDAGADISRHELRNRLNAVNLGIRLARRQFESQHTADANATLQKVLDELQRLDSTVGASRETVRKISDERPLQLLVVEDDDNERELLAGLLKLHGFAVRTAANGDDAFAQLADDQLPDYVLLDMKMPRVDGPELLSRIRSSKRLRQLRVFAVSGTSPDELGVRDDCDGWFAKPLDPEQLVQAMSRATSTGAVSTTV